MTKSLSSKQPQLFWFCPPSPVIDLSRETNAYTCHSKPLEQQLFSALLDLSLPLEGWCLWILSLEAYQHFFFRSFPHSLGGIASKFVRQWKFHSSQNQLVEETLMGHLCTDLTSPLPEMLYCQSSFYSPLHRPVVLNLGAMVSGGAMRSLKQCYKVSRFYKGWELLA